MVFRFQSQPVDLIRRGGDKYGAESSSPLKAKHPLRESLLAKRTYFTGLPPILPALAAMCARRKS